jgi:hypothetical protein
VNTIAVLIFLGGEKKEVHNAYACFSDAISFFWMQMWPWDCSHTAELSKNDDVSWLSSQGCMRCAQRADSGVRCAFSCMLSIGFTALATENRLQSNGRFHHGSDYTRHAVL